MFYVIIAIYISGVYFGYRSTTWYQRMYNIYSPPALEYSKFMNICGALGSWLAVVTSYLCVLFLKKVK